MPENQPKAPAPQGLPGPHAQPDAAARLWAPWRLAYLESMKDQPDASPPASPPASTASSTHHASFLGHYWATPQLDAAHHVVERTPHGLILLNKYPYANGHLLVALGPARPRLLDYDAGQRAALWALVDRACAILERALEPQGVNIGLNQGRAAGAGVPGHLHVHLVPRWGGDVNFMTTVGSVRVIPGSLEAMFERMMLARALVDAAPIA
jgi:ATP adenylyltransferase